MNYFDGHAFSLYGSHPEHQEIVRRIPVYYGIQYNHAGRFLFALNHGERQIYEGPHAFITHPGAFFEYGNLPGETRHHSFICSWGERLEEYVEKGLLPVDQTVFPIHDPERFLGTMVRIMTLLRRNSPITPPRAVLLYEDLLLQLHEAHAANPTLPPGREDPLRRLQDDIRRHPEKEWDFTREANRNSLTLPHFRKLFKTLSGLPPQQFLIHCRLETAARILVESTLPVSEVAETAGIPNEFYFSRLFKRKYRLPPLQYRREFTASLS